MIFDQRNEVPLRVSPQGGNTKIRIGGNKARRFAMQVGEVTTATTRHEYLLADLVRAFEHDDAAATIPSRDGTHESGGATANNDDVEIVHGRNIAGGIGRACSSPYVNGAAGEFLNSIAQLLQSTNVVLDSNAQLLVVPGRVLPRPFGQGAASTGARRNDNLAWHVSSGESFGRPRPVVPGRSGLRRQR